jgi:CHAD domain-containing protein
MVETLDELVERFSNRLNGDAFGDVRAKLVDAHEIVRQRVVHGENTMEHVAVIIQRGRSRIKDWPIEDDRFAALRDGLERVYKRGRKALWNARTEPSMVNLHELRKRAKYLWYQARILGPSWSELLGELADQIHALSGYLGDDHDLALLGGFLQDRSGEMFPDQSERAAFSGLLAERRNELQAAAWPLGERIYVEEPRDFVQRMAGYWRVWRT